MSGGNGQAAAAAAKAFDDAHRALRADPSIQFGMGPVKPPQPPYIPAWLRWLGDQMRYVGKFFAWLTSFMPAAPYARILLWGVIAALLLLLVWLIVDRVRSGEWHLPLQLQRKRARQIATDAADEDWAPDAAPAREWLAEADALAARGLYAEAVHHLLFRSVEDIKRRRPQIVRPSLTSRELAAAGGIPTIARDLFAKIARQVENSLFGGRAVGADDWRTARAAYADFALPGQWQA